MSITPISFRTSIVVAIWVCAYGLDASTTWTIKSASLISSKVDLNDSIKWWGRLLTNPTVSVIKNYWLVGSLIERVEVSNVAKSIFFTNTCLSLSLSK